MTLFRSVEVRAVDTEARTFEGLAVPYGVTIDVPSEGIRERFERGAFGDFKNVPVYWMHEASENVRATPIGMVTHGEDTDEGYFIKGRISDTVKGTEIHTLMRDGVVNSLSVGFEPVKDSIEDGVTVRSKALLREVSVVTVPAYADALVSAVRNEQSSEVSTTEEINNEEDNMSEEIKEVLSRVANLEEANEEVTRRLAVREDESVKDAPKVAFRSAGEYVTALAKGESDARDEYNKIVSRAYTGQVLADFHTHEEWKTDLLKVVNKPRNIINLFSKGALPAQGMSVDAVTFTGTTGTVNSQVAEGDTLTTIKVDTDVVSYPVKVYGAYSELSRQAIERSDIDSLDLVLQAQAAEYAKATNGYVRSVLAAATPQTGTSLTLSTAKGKDWLNAVIDGMDAIDENAKGAEAEFILVSTDVYVQIATLADSTDRPLLNVNFDGSNTYGNVRGLAGTFAGLPMFYDRSLAAKTMYVASSKALTTWEVPGVPFRLDDENPTNLTRVYSVYGYIAAGATNQLALVKPTIA